MGRQKAHHAMEERSLPNPQLQAGVLEEDLPSKTVERSSVRHPDYPYRQVVEMKRMVKRKDPNSATLWKAGLER